MADLGAVVKPDGLVAVVGGGWAGCAAAATLARAGRPVLLLEASADLGGRARRVELQLGDGVHALDNGQHLLIGAYTATARLLADLGVALDSVVERRPFELRYPDGFRLQAAELPAPWHLAAALVTARGLPLADRVALVRFLRTLRMSGWRAQTDMHAAAWLAAHRQSERLVARVWRPLAIAALNTALPDASAQLLANVLRDSLGARADAAALWLPRVDLSALLPAAVERFVTERGGLVRRNARVQAVQRADEGFRLELLAHGQPEQCAADAVIYAGPPAQLAAVAGPLGASLEPALTTVAALSYQPIYTVYLKYDGAVAIPSGFLALLDDPDRRRYGQWVFDRGALDRANRGVLAVVISAHGPHEAEPLAAVCEAVSAQLASELGLPAPLDARAIVEKRATLTAAPALKRPANATAVPGFALAGDWTDSDYPSTLEAAVRSGVAAARLLLN